MNELEAFQDIAMRLASHLRSLGYKQTAPELATVLVPMRALLRAQDKAREAITFAGGSTVGMVGDLRINAIGGYTIRFHGVTDPAPIVLTADEVEP